MIRLGLWLAAQHPPVHHVTLVRLNTNPPRVSLHYGNLRPILIPPNIQNQGQHADVQAIAAPAAIPAADTVTGPDTGPAAAPATALAAKEEEDATAGAEDSSSGTSDELEQEAINDAKGVRNTGGAQR